MCLEPGEELFKAINHGGKDELFSYTSVWLYGKKKVKGRLPDHRHLGCDFFGSVAYTHIRIRTV
jgi:hypothetical protein